MIRCRVCDQETSAVIGAPVCEACREKAGPELMDELDRVVVNKKHLSARDRTAWEEAHHSAWAAVREAVGA